MGVDKVLVLDDEMIIRRTLQEYCHRKRIKVRTVGTVAEAIKALSGDHGFDVMFLDVNLPDGEGTEILEAMEGRENSPLAIMITGQGSIESAVRCMRLGAYDYLLKPFSTDQIDMVLERTRKYNRLVQVNRALSSEGMGGGGEIIGDSLPMARLKDLVQCVARTDATVMVSGETGTGKEMIAHAIHRNSLRKDKPFIRVNCAAVSESLIESEFFGHEKGAFTGALQSRIGRFELADGGTLLLDEISEVSLSLQAKLLRVLQEKELERVGGTKTIKVDVRIIATTNRNLEESVETGEFRQDLYYRLNVFPVQSPALRERREDVPGLARHFLGIYGRKHGRKLSGFSEPAMNALLKHDWPGNVRELQNTVERAVILSVGKSRVDIGSLPLDLQVLASEGMESETAAGCHNFEFESSNGHSVLNNGSGRELLVAEPMVSEVSEAEDLSDRILPGSDSEDWSLEAMERRLVFETLERTEGNRTKAAELMKVSIRTLFNKINAYKKKGYEEFTPYFS